VKQIGAIGSAVPKGVHSILSAIKQNIEELRGTRGVKIKPLPDNATLPDVIKKVNEIITLMQG